MVPCVISVPGSLPLNMQHPFAHRPDNILIDRIAAHLCSFKGEIEVSFYLSLKEIELYPETSGFYLHLEVTCVFRVKPDAPDHFLH